MNSRLKEYFDKGYNIVWDIDGTLTEARWEDIDITGSNETPYKIKKLHFNGESLYIKPLPVMKKNGF